MISTQNSFHNTISENLAEVEDIGVNKQQLYPDLAQQILGDRMLKNSR